MGSSTPPFHPEPTLAVTGHRLHKLGPSSKLRVILDATIGALQSLRPAVVCSGMAVGFDQLVCQACILLDIPFDACVPFPGQERRWPRDAQRDYHFLLSRARRVLFGTETDASKLSDSEIRTLLFDRNRFMVDRCSSLLACWDGSLGGTFHCYNYASIKDIPIERIDPRLLPNTRPLAGRFIEHPNSDSMISYFQHRKAQHGRMGVGWWLASVSERGWRETWDGSTVESLLPSALELEASIGNVDLIPVPDVNSKFASLLVCLCPYKREPFEEDDTQIGFLLCLEAVRRKVLALWYSNVRPTHLVYSLGRKPGLSDAFVQRAMLECFADLDCFIHVVHLDDD